MHALTMDSFTQREAGLRSGAAIALFAGNQNEKQASITNGHFQEDGSARE